MGPQDSRPRLRDAHLIADGRRTSRQRERTVRFVDRRGVVPFEAQVRLGRAVGEHPHVDAERNPRADLDGRGELGHGRVAGGRRREQEREDRECAPAETCGRALEIAVGGEPVRQEEQPRNLGGVDQAGAETGRQRGIGRGAARRREPGQRDLRHSAGDDLLRADGEADDPRRRISTSGGRARQRRECSTLEGERVVGDAVRNVGQRHDGDRTGGPPELRSGQRGCHPGQDQRAQRGLQRQLPLRKIGQRAPKQQEQRRCRHEQQEPGGPLEPQPCARGEGGHVVHRRW